MEVQRVSTEWGTWTKNGHPMFARLEGFQLIHWVCMPGENVLRQSHLIHWQSSDHTLCYHFLLFTKCIIKNGWWKRWFYIIFLALEKTFKSFWVSRFETKCITHQLNHIIEGFTNIHLKLHSIQKPTYFKSLLTIYIALNKGCPRKMHNFSIYIMSELLWIRSLHSFVFNP